MRKLWLLLIGVLACEPEYEWSSNGGQTVGGGPRMTVSAAPLTGTSVTPLTGGQVAVADPDGDSVFMVIGGGRSTMRLPAGSRPVRSGPGRAAGISLYAPIIVKYRDEKTDTAVRLEELLR